MSKLQKDKRRAGVNAAMIFISFEPEQKTDIRTFSAIFGDGARDRKT